jgi:polysaccharide pyruvyl transferase WcaK-like protein
LRALAATLGVADRVHFIGWVDGVRKHQLMARARLVAVPSRFETFGIVAVEALAAGTPLVAFDIPCLREVIPPEAGVLVPSFRVEDYAAALMRTHGNSALQQQARASGPPFAARYDWDDLARRQEQFYRDTVAPAAAAVGNAHIHTNSREVLQHQLRSVGRRRPHGRRRLTILGNVGNGNTGDESLLTVVLQHLAEDTDVTVVSRNPRAVRALHAVASVPMTVKSAWSTLRGTDGVVIVGGGMFGPGLPPLVRFLPAAAEMAAVLGKDLAYVGVGVYPGTPPTTRAFLRRAAHRGQLTVRDQLSIDTLSAQRTPPNIGDLAFQLQPAAPTSTTSLLDQAGVRHDRPLLLIAPKAATSAAKTKHMLTTLSAAVGHWTKNGGQVAALALSAHVDYGMHSAASDVQLAAAIASRTGTRIPVLGPNLHPTIAAGLVAQADALIGLRFHALVFAEASGRPCMGFDWEPKSAALIREWHIAVAHNDQSVQNWLDEMLHLQANAG